jgi:hypothetical protein
MNEDDNTTPPEDWREVTSEKKETVQLLFKTSATGR